MDSSEREVDTEEQIRGRQNNEFKALKECFSDQLVDLRKLTKVSKNPKKRKRDNLWVPLELMVKLDTQPEPIAGFELHVRCSRKYPLVPPAIGFKSVRGIGRTLITKLHKQLKQEAANDELKGQGCIALLIMRAQQFLEDHYADFELNNKSFYDQMVEQKQNCHKKAQLNRKRQDEMDKLERERQVEEIRQKILRKRELYNESRRRRDSQNSALETELEDTTPAYDYDGDLADSTTTSLADEAENNRLGELEELNESALNNDDTLVKSRRNTFVGSRSQIGAFNSTESDSVTVAGGGGGTSGGQRTSQGSIVQSRVGLEYEVLEELGHGGFGTVYKVRNQVDSRLYALKKVKLNPDNETLNERIMREVKLLSRLNHENVIRYYTAWSETEICGSKTITTRDHSATPDAATNSLSSAMGGDLSQKKKRPESCIRSQRDISHDSSDDETHDLYHTSYLINDHNVERVDSGDITANYVVFETSDNKDENEIVESMKKALGSGLSDQESSDDEGTKNSQSSALSGAGGNKLRINHWLYIQMELGQGTLREAIDRGLPKQKDRARRFFREILDGLCHIHRQGIIHRDLKPVNVFLDSMDRPKIGDFGLATTNLFIVTQTAEPGVPTAQAIKPNRMSLEKLRHLATPDVEAGAGDSPCDSSGRSGERLKYVQCSQTDNIGTPLYMSPELSATNEKTRISKVVYSHKVDVYSLGIIYFEMLYPFKTGHERVIILQNMRKKEILMPSDIDNHLTKEDQELIRLLLTHDVAARPTSEKLLTSNLLPSIGLKEREYQNIIKQVVQNRQARTHKHMLKLLFEQNDSYVDDFVFDFEDSSTSSPNAHASSAVGLAAARFDPQSLLKDFNTNVYLLDQVKMKLENLLRCRGYVNFATPTLMPKYTAAKYYSKQQIENVVMLMDKNSSILTLPYDLRLPFARAIARTNINYMNRFAMEKIFRQRQVLGYHPDQLWECCVDLVTPPLPTGPIQAQTSDAEVINLMGEVVRILPVLQPLKPVIKINDTRLVKSLLLMLGIAETSLDELLNCISESLSVSVKRVTQSHVSSFGVSAQPGNSLAPHVKEELKKDLLASRLVQNPNQASNLISLLDMIGPTASELLEQVEQFYSSRHLKTVGHLDSVRHILQALGDTIIYAQGLGLDSPVSISPAYVLYALRPVDFYSGMVCLLECRRYHRAKTKTQLSKTVILAVGGRYDRLIERFSRNRLVVFDRMRSSELDKGTNSSTGSSEHENCPKTAVGVSFEVEKMSRFVLEDYVERVNNLDTSVTTPNRQRLIQTTALQQALIGGGSSNSSMNLSTSSGASALSSSQSHLIPFPIRYWPMDVAIYSITQPRPPAYISVISNLVRQLRELDLVCHEMTPMDLSHFTLSSLTMHCLENRIPYVLTVKSQSNDALSTSILSASSSTAPTALISSTSISGSTVTQSTTLATGDHSPASSVVSGQNVANISGLSSSASGTAIGPGSPVASAGGRCPGSPPAGQNCIATLYQLERGRLREIKRCDIPNMLSYLVKRG